MPDMLTQQKNTGVIFQTQNPVLTCFLNQCKPKSHKSIWNNLIHHPISGYRAKHEKILSRRFPSAWYNKKPLTVSTANKNCTEFQLKSGAVFVCALRESLFCVPHFILDKLQYLITCLVKHHINLLI